MISDQIRDGLATPVARSRMVSSWRPRIGLVTVRRTSFAAQMGLGFPARTNAHAARSKAVLRGFADVVAPPVIKSGADAARGRGRRWRVRIWTPSSSPRRSPLRPRTRCARSTWSTRRSSSGAPRRSGACSSDTDMRGTNGMFRLDSDPSDEAISRWISYEVTTTTPSPPGGSMSRSRSSPPRSGLIGSASEFERSQPT